MFVMHTAAHYIQGTRRQQEADVALARALQGESYLSPRLLSTSETTASGKLRNATSGLPSLSRTPKSPTGSEVPTASTDVAAVPSRLKAVSSSGAFSSLGCTRSSTNSWTHPCACQFNVKHLTLLWHGFYIVSSKFSVAARYAPFSQHAGAAEALAAQRAPCWQRLPGAQMCHE